MEMAVLFSIVAVILLIALIAKQKQPPAENVEEDSFDFGSTGPFDSDSIDSLGIRATLSSGESLDYADPASDTQIDFTVRGISYHNRDGTLRARIIWCSVYHGDKVELRRERDNPADQNAIAVWHPRGQVGYVPQGLTRDVSLGSARVIGVRGVHEDDRNAQGEPWRDEYLDVHIRADLTEGAIERRTYEKERDKKLEQRHIWGVFREGGRVMRPRKSRECRICPSSIESGEKAVHATELGESYYGHLSCVRSQESEILHEWREELMSYSPRKVNGRNEYECVLCLRSIQKGEQHFHKGDRFHIKCGTESTLPF